MTNAHVVWGDSTPALVSPDGRRLEATVIGISEEPDVAVLQVDVDLPLTLRWANPADLEEGQRLMALGFPRPGRDFSATPGSLVSFQIEGGGRSAIRTDAALDHGNSGGPMLTQEGQVAGVVTRMADNEGGFQSVPLAFTSHSLGQVVEEMIDRPQAIESDCSGLWVDDDPVLPQEPDEPYEIIVPDIDPYEPYEPWEPPAQTTTTVPCPTGRPTVNVTKVTAQQVDPEWLPQSWDIVVRGTVTNSTSASIYIWSIDVRIDGLPGTTMAFATAYTLRAGESTPFEATAYASDLSTNPDFATVDSFDWDWSDYEHSGCGTA